MHAIRSQGLSRRFGEHTAVSRLDLAVRAGEIYGLVGPDGAGKTTTMRLLTSILEPTAGDAWVNGHHVIHEPERVKESIAYMSQRFGLYADLTVLENIHFYADLYEVPRRERGERIEELLGFSNLTPFQHRRAGALSGGMKQKLGLACALVHEPRVLFLDEPTNGVDPVSRRDFWRILHQLLRKGVTIFVSTAYLDEAERCQHLGLLHEGRLLASGTPDEVKQMVRGTILEIRTSGARQAWRTLASELGRDAVALFGDRIHVTATDPDAADRRIRSILASTARAKPTIRHIPPSLEDVFVSVLAGSDDGH